MPDPTIAKLRLRHQHLSAPMRGSAADVVRWLGAVQAQDYAGAKWGLGVRLRGIREDAVEQACASGAILRTHILRPTWHFVTPADIRWMQTLTAPHVQALNASMNRKMSLDAATLGRAIKVMCKALGEGRHLTRAELGACLQRAGIVPASGQRLAYIVAHAELEAVLCSGARRGKQFTYALLDDCAPAGRRLDRADALVLLARRYFSSRGPATVHDFARWSGLSVAAARQGLEGVQPELEPIESGGRQHWMPPSRASRSAGQPAALLLSVYDEYISGYRDRTAIGRDEDAKKLGALGNALLHVVVLDGQLAGSWTRSFERERIVIDIRPFARLKGDSRDAVVRAGEAYARFWKLPGELRGL
jgi:hypothetical protein